MSAAKTNRINRQELPQDTCLSTPTPRLVDKGGAIRAHEIGTAAWSAFCPWFTHNFHDLDTSIERVEGTDQRTVECLDQRFESIAVTMHSNGVPGIDVVVGYDGKTRIVEVAGPRWLRLHYNAAGWPTLLEIGYEEGKLVLRFSGAARFGPTFTGNSWGE